MNSTTSNIAVKAATTVTPVTAATTASASTAVRTDLKTALAKAAGKSAAPPPAPAKEDTALQRDPRSLQYLVQGDKVITTIVDDNDKTVVVQIPDAEMIRIAKSIDRMQGFLVRSKA